MLYSSYDSCPIIIRSSFWNVSTYIFFLSPQDLLSETIHSRIVIINPFNRKVNIMVDLNSWTRRFTAHTLAHHHRHLRLLLLLCRFSIKRNSKPIRSFTTCFWSLHIAPARRRLHPLHDRSRLGQIRRLVHTVSVDQNHLYSNSFSLAHSHNYIASTNPFQIESLESPSVACVLLLGPDFSWHLFLTESSLHFSIWVGHSAAQWKGSGGNFFL